MKRRHHVNNANEIPRDGRYWTLHRTLLETEPIASRMPGRHSATELTVFQALTKHFKLTVCITIAIIQTGMEEGQHL